MSALSGLLPRARLGRAAPALSLPPFGNARARSRVARRASSSRRDHDDRLVVLSLHDVVVVGNGPIGSAVARHVAETGASVLVVDGKRT